LQFLFPKGNEMVDVVHVVEVIAIGILGFFVFYLFVLTLLALFARTRTTFSARRLRKFAVVVPAYNEELVIRKTLSSLNEIDYPKDKYDLVVIADNCSDRTAEVATQEGAFVFERIDPEHRGKGFALRACFDFLLRSNAAYESVVVIDADSVVSSNFLSVMNHYLERGHQSIQSTDIADPAQGPWNLEMIRIGFLLYNYVRPLGRRAVHLPTGLRGNGMCFDVAILRNIPWQAYSSTEDLEYGLQLLLHGVPTYFASEACVYATMPQTLTNAKSQRLRWEGGRFPIIRNYALLLIRAAIVLRSFRLVDTFIDLVTPPLVNLMAASVFMLVVTLLVTLLGTGLSWAYVWIWCAVIAGGFFHMLVGLGVARAEVFTYRALLHLPKYAIWKIVLYVASLLSGGKGKGWIRTARETPKASDQRKP
jgi:1,2-diacylglycerol 3-beta-glucosyltransferase